MGALCCCCARPAAGNRWQAALVLHHLKALNWVGLFLDRRHLCLLHVLIRREPLRDDADVDFPGGLEAVGFFLVLQVPPCTCCGCPAHCRLGHAPQCRLLIHGWRLTCSRVGRASGSLDSIHEIKLRASVKKIERNQPIKSLDYGNEALVLLRERKQKQSYFSTPEYELFC